MTTPTSKKHRKKWLKWAVIALVIAALGWWLYNKFKPSDKPPNYITAVASLGDIENNVMASGKVKAINTVEVGAQVSGEVTKLFVDVGAVVKQGDLIAQIDQVSQKNNLSNQQATLQQGKAGLQSAKADYLSRQASLESAYADLASRQAELKQAQADLARLQPLVAMQAISQQELDVAQTKVATVAASVTNAKAAIKTAQAGMMSAQATIVSNQADLQKAQTNLDTANTDLGYTTIRAPIAGTVVSVVTEQGTTVNANQSAPTIVTLADLSTVRINAQISEADVINVKAGMPVYFNMIGNPDEKYTGVLTAIEPAPEQISNTSSTDSAIYYVGYVEVPNPEQQFRIDMTAQVFIVMNQAKNVLLVPSAAVKKGSTMLGAGANSGGTDATKDLKPIPKATAAKPIPNGTYVRVLNSDGTVDNRSVKVGIDNRVNAQILEGIAAGDTVIISEDSGESKQGGSGRPPRL